MHSFKIINRIQKGYAGLTQSLRDVIPFVSINPAGGHRGRSIPR